jgi:hypothetical protein
MLAAVRADLRFRDPRSVRSTTGISRCLFDDWLGEAEMIRLDLDRGV